MGIKASDRDAIPLCYECHRTGPRSYHNVGEQAFLSERGIDLPTVIGSLRGRYRLEVG